MVCSCGVTARAHGVSTVKATANLPAKEGGDTAGCVPGKGDMNSSRDLGFSAHHARGAARLLWCRPRDLFLTARWLPAAGKTEHPGSIHGPRSTLPTVRAPHGLEFRQASRGPLAPSPSQRPPSAHWTCPQNPAGPQPVAERCRTPALDILCALLGISTGCLGHATVSHLPPGCELWRLLLAPI